ncbi:MAG TPA: CopD family protein [Methylomirabilota bacterium]|jgi:putative copper resistance protein D|nr:CopD family protein [Methylomirabilota bacterium]
MTPLGLAARWAHLVCGVGLVGIFTALLLAGISERPTAQAWTGRVLSLTRWLTGGLLLSGLALLAYQVMVAAGRPDAIVDASLWLRLLGQSRFGTVWLIRHGLLILLAALLLLREGERSRADALAWRLQGWALSAAALAAMAWAGHAAAVEAVGVPAVLGDALHLIAAGAWLGALPPLALLLSATSRETGADARPFAVLAVRRFSAMAAITIGLIIASGLCNAWVEIGSVPALIGTRYGWLLLVKMALVVPIVALGLINRRRLIPALSGDGATVGRPAMARLASLVVWELALGVVILGLTAGLSLTPPARHESPWWPFGFRLSYDATAGLPGTRPRLFIGSQLAILGLIAAAVGWLVKSRRGLLVGGGSVAVLVGLWIALPPLSVDAYPTTYRRSSLTYQSASVARGIALYATHCAVCHGRGGKGDGPGGAGLRRLPADLTAPHAAQHTAGDLYWWISHGIPASGMPAFAQTLSDDERWDLINFLRALSAGEQARALTPVVEPGRPRLVAPDFTYSVGPVPPRSLREFRGRSMVLLVLFQLPESRRRLDQLAGAYREIEYSGTEIVAVPLDADPGIITRLGARPPILYPVATEGAAEIARTYALFAQTAPRHAEFLIDRQGYLRARWMPGVGGRGWDDLRMLRADIDILAKEAPSSPPADEHVH